MIARLWRNHRALVIAFLVALALALFFAMGAVRMARDFRIEKDHPVAAWMTPRYVAHSWDVPQDEMMDILGVTPDQPGRVTLAELAAERGMPVQEYLYDIQTRLAVFSADRDE